LKQQAYPSDRRDSVVSRVLGSWVHEVDTRTLRADAAAGLLGAVLVLPQAIAFALLAGLPVQYGLYTAIVPCVIAALFGSSRHVMSGPTNAISLALFAMLAPLAMAGTPEYIELALVVTLMVGLIQASIAIFKLGTIANFISPAVLGGFTSGAAVLIALYALSGALGLDTADVHGVGAKLASYVSQRHAIEIASILVALATGAAALLIRHHLGLRWPFMLLGLVVGTALGVGVNLLPPGASIGQVAQVGALPSPLPLFHIPSIHWERIPDLMGIAFALSIVALGQSISIAKAIGIRSGQTIDPNREFLGQGLSNLVGGLFSSYVSCGSLNRSLPNLEAGARTPLASVAAALLLIGLVALFSPALAYLPMAGISALLILVAWSLFDWRRWKVLWTQQRTEFMIAATTAIATILLRMEIAILLGTLMSLVVYLSRTAKPAMRDMGFLSRDPGRHLENLDDLEAAGPETTEARQVLTCPQLAMVRMEGTVYFAATAHVWAKLTALRTQKNAPKHLLVLARSMNFIDLSGAELWEQERLARLKMGGDLYFQRPRQDVLNMWKRTGFTHRLGADHMFHTKEQAIEAIFKTLDRDICSHCTVRAFRECASLPEPKP